MIELRVLGALQVTVSGREEVEPLAHQAKRAALLAYLAAATPRGRHRRDKLLAPCSGPSWIKPVRGRP